MPSSPLEGQLRPSVPRPSNPGAALDVAAGTPPFWRGPVGGTAERVVRLRRPGFEPRVPRRALPSGGHWAPTFPSSPLHAVGTTHLAKGMSLCPSSRTAGRVAGSGLLAGAGSIAGNESSRTARRAGGGREAFEGGRRVCGRRRGGGSSRRLGRRAIGGRACTWRGERGRGQTPRDGRDTGAPERARSGDGGRTDGRSRESAWNRPCGRQETKGGRPVRCEARAAGDPAQRARAGQGPRAPGRAGRGAARRKSKALRRGGLRVGVRASAGS